MSFVETVAGKCSVKKVFSKTLQNSKENIVTGVTLLMKILLVWGNEFTKWPL